MQAGVNYRRLLITEVNACSRAHQRIAVRNVRESGSCSDSIHFRKIPVTKSTIECNTVVNSFFNSMLGTRKLTPTWSTPMRHRLAMGSCLGSTGRRL